MKWAWYRVNSMVFQVSESEDLGILIARLRDANTPTAIHVIGTTQNLKEGKITAKVFTDKWPHFSAVVCHIIEPRMSEVGEVYSYATSYSALVDVLWVSGLVRKGSVIGLPKFHTDHILQAFPELKVAYEGISYYLPPGMLKGDERICPSGFIVGKLTPSQENIAVVSSHWKYLDDGPKKTSFLKGSLENGHSCAIYTSDNTNTLVAWGMQYGHGEIGHVYTLPAYRRRGLASIVVRELCKAILADGLTPEVMIEEGNSDPLTVYLKLGFVESGHRFNFVSFSGTL